MDSTACLLAVLLPALPAGEAPRGAEEKRPPEAVNDTGPWKLPQEGYRQALRGVARESGSAGSVTVEVSAAPDAYRYQMAEGMEEIRKSLSQISTPCTEAEREGGWRGAPTRRS